MSFSPSTTRELSNQLQGDFLDYLNELYDVELSEVFADAVNRFLLEEFNGEIDQDLEVELAVNLIENLRVVNVNF
ncbi:hypothetical protein [Synechococcus phage S-N03]|uniref:Uncharacterized protein n=1 Tax=Synechococcus phage S-N03 TaxID=2718943 RepID=A0A6G8R5R4_9CAUD|nr:hypothetical protein PQC09_gp078 [Synechococcus phage S-N03]QIN96713.1 hypothetical protein [Synechococcus phage S-N03]